MPTIDQVLETAFAHQRAGRLRLAEQICSGVLAQAPGHAGALQLLGVNEMLQGRHSDAASTLRQALAANPRDATLHNDIGEALRGMRQFDQAKACYLRSIQLNPNLAKPHVNLGTVLGILADYANAKRAFRRALELEPENHTAHCNLAGVLLAEGELEEGWREFAWRAREPKHPSHRKTAPHWDGSPMPEGRLEVYAEQGFGDTLQFIRYLPLIEPLVGEIVAVIQPELIPLLTVSGFHNMVPASAAAGTSDAHVSLLDLPLVSGTTLETIPSNVPYLRADPALIEQWRDKLPQTEGLKVGITWQGNPNYYLDHFRSIPFSAWEPLSAVPGIQLISLQTGLVASGCGDMLDRFGVTRLADFEAGNVTFLDTAAVIMNLDLVITSDTVTAHLAGALGVPVWIALCASPCWRWLIGRNDSPWYPSMRLFRQERLRHWSDVFASIADALARERWEGKSGATTPP